MDSSEEGSEYEIGRRFEELRVETPQVTQPKRKRQGEDEDEEEVTDEVRYTHMKEDDWLYGPDAEEEEDKENPILPDEAPHTHKDYCWACIADKSSRDATTVTYWKESITPYFKAIDPKIAVYTIRNLYNKLVRPHLPPGIKQRWTKRNIMDHILFHPADIGDMLVHGVRKVGKIMRLADREMIMIKEGKRLLNPKAAKVYMEGVALLARLKQKETKSSKKPIP